MRNIFRVFAYDMKTLSRHFFAMAVAVAITILPSLYAWLNIYSNWDPYGNTGNVSIALASMDKGYVTKDGKLENKGQDVLDDLRDATSINWVILDNEKEAVNGVYSGKYYAAVVIDEDFSYNMFNMLTEWTGKPSITYYENAKKNAVATKITDTAASSVKSSINENYLEVVVSSVMEQANLIADDIKEDDPSGAVHSILKQAIHMLDAANGMMDKVSGDTLSSVQLNIQNIDELLLKINEKIPDPTQMRQTVAQIGMTLDKTTEDIDYALTRLSLAINDEKALELAKKPILTAAEDMHRNGQMIETTIKQWEADNVGMTQETKDYLQSLADSCYETEGWLRSIADSPVIDNSIIARTDSLRAVIELNASLMPCIEDVNIEIEATFDNVANTLESTKVMLSDATMLRGALENVKDAGQNVIDTLRPTAKRVTSSLTDALRRLDTLDGEEYLQTLVEILGGNPVLYGEYFAQVVQTSVTPVYPIENYGSAMAPFYTILAIWVGGVILGAILKAHARTDGLVDPKPHELYFGRYILFFVLSQLQTALIISGDLFILKIQCLHPGLLYLVGFVTSFTFSLLIYSLAVSFGDVGKAIVVVVMVLQIAGSSGTFPIELLPEIFQKIYRFFPFPYAIDAMRECICGLYGNTIVIKLGQLLIFAVVALGIGLFARKPFMGINEFMEERLEATEMF